MKKNYSILLVVTLFALNAISQIGFDEVKLEGWVGNGSNQAMFIVDFGSSPVGSDSAFAWGVNFESDSINGDEILAMIEENNPEFTYSTGGGFLSNIAYNSNGITYTNPNEGWFSILESEDGENWLWNLGIYDNVGNSQWYGMVAMNTVTYEAEINVPLLTSVENNLFSQSIEVYPNPASGLFTVSLAKKVHIILTNSSGKVIDEAYSEDEIFDVSELSPGLYILNFVSDDNIESRKLIVK